MISSSNPEITLKEENETVHSSHIYGHPHSFSNWWERNVCLDLTTQTHHITPSQSCLCKAQWKEQKNKTFSEINWENQCPRTTFLRAQVHKTINRAWKTKFEEMEISTHSKLFTVQNGDLVISNKSFAELENVSRLGYTVVLTGWFTFT